MWNRVKVVASNIHQALESVLSGPNQTDTIMSQVVPLLVPAHTIWQVVGILGISLGGGVYCPLSVEYPSDRLRQLLDDTRAEVVLTLEEYVNHVSE
eukprot:gene43239-52852_t